jgi:hypothetical protein
MEKSRITSLTLIAVLLLFCFIPLETFAEPAEDPFLPGGEIDSPFYTKYPPDKFILDAVPADNNDFSTNLYIFTNNLLDSAFYLYMWLVEFGIRLVNWVFDIDLGNQLIAIVEEVMPLLRSSVWDEFWYLAFSIGFLGMVILFGRGDNRSSFNVFVALFTIICLAPVFFKFWPGIMKQVNEVATYTSGKILNQMIETPDEKQNISPLKQNNRSPWIQSENLHRRVEIRQSIHAVDDSLWKAFVYEPYLTVNFGDKALGEKHFEALMAKGTDTEERKKYLKQVGGIDESGKTEKEEFKIFTDEGIKQRMKYSFSALLLSALPLITLAVFSFCVLFWTLLAIGRAILMVVQFLLSFWPGYGLQNAAYYLYSTVAALAMKVFYSIVLAVFLRIWIAFNDPDSFPGLNLGGKVILLFLTLWGFWIAVTELREKISQARGIFGGQSRIDAGINEMELAKGRLQKAGLVGMRQTQSRLARLSRKKPNFTRSIRGAKAVGGAVGGKVVELAKPKQDQLKSNLSDNARKVFNKMQQFGFDPEKEEDRLKFAETRPEYKAEVHELGKWFDNPDTFKFQKMPDVEDGKVLPPEPPKAGTPEYIIWKRNPKLQQQWDLYTKVRKQMHDEAYKKYLKKRHFYENNLFVRMVKRRPKFDDFRPSQRKVAKQYKKLLKENKKLVKETAN